MEQRGSSELVGDGISFTTIHMPLVKTPMIAPTKIYDKFPTITPAQAADMVIRAMVEQPHEINTALGNLGAVAHTRGAEDDVPGAQPGLPGVPRLGRRQGRSARAGHAGESRADHAGQGVQGRALVTLRITGLSIHPVKSTAIRPVESAEVLARGLADDRSWAVFDSDGVLVSAREVHELFTVVADTPATDPSMSGGVCGSPHPACRTCCSTSRPVRWCRCACSGRTSSASRRVRPRMPGCVDAVGRQDLRLVWCDDPSRRTLNPAHSTATDHTAYADGYPVTLASGASLRQLNDWLVETALERGEEPPEPLPVQRFRPNLVIDGDEPFAEDHWSHLSISGIRFRVAKPAGRCVVTTIDLETLRTGKEPIRTLARHRRPVTDTLFAVHLIPDGTGTIRVGDEVSVG